MKKFVSWGAVSPSKHLEFIDFSSRYNNLPYTDLNVLVCGNGRCYGDEAYNDGGMLLNGLSLNKFIEFDRDNGCLTAECGVTFEEILSLIVPVGWFLPVTPGTKFITLGGAVANDVHGKNHHRDGSFGCFVESFELLRSDGSRFVCSKEHNSEYFYATIGGLGLTGMILWVKFKLLAISNSAIITTAQKFSNLKEYFLLNSRLEFSNKYTVAWIDCAASQAKLGRGIYFTGEHAGYLEKIPQQKHSNISFPIKSPISLMNKYSIKLLNELYYHRPVKSRPHTTHYDPFFYPLDAINNWNRIYGRKGFYQYQAVVPMENAETTIAEMLREISFSKMGSFLAVLKTFGDISSGGMMSFPRKGVTLALDFANTGVKTQQLFEKLDKITFAAQGAIYPAKDACMSSQMFVAGYDRLDEFRKYVDPKFSSNLWVRVNK
jgi:FAD/FMN-containing dehydrogenase